MSGLRSVGTERPSFTWLLGPSGPGSPTPENDSYVQACEPARRRRMPPANRRTKLDEAGDETERRRGSCDRLESARRGSVTSKSRRTPTTTRSASSLGRPEPLPGLGACEASPVQMLGVHSRLGLHGRPTRNDRELDDVAGSRRARRSRRATAGADRLLAAEPPTVTSKRGLRKPSCRRPRPSSTP